ncbi:hypothetical protein CBS63078_1305 [Aspergillus niger]|nr:hypothetical protein CBS115989_3630 [Aspergillus niger]KAI2831727.1 hypothetical protein CBS133816_2319 [Aspergillus niger]KAI2853507.1 hypothetical protein CBS11350_245 [Aspergillus niger]KAI2860844.1 hypothetical protein CBS12448_5122 [Aspergillus niger]KAI2861278.1 hypothetical protein CBS11232_914 [Aspergillus niger]
MVTTHNYSMPHLNTTDKLSRALEEQLKANCHLIRRLTLFLLTTPRYPSFCYVYMRLRILPAARESFHISMQRLFSCRIAFAATA